MLDSEVGTLPQRKPRLPHHETSILMGDLLYLTIEEQPLKVEKHKEQVENSQVARAPDFRLDLSSLFAKPFSRHTFLRERRLFSTGILQMCPNLLAYQIKRASGYHCSKAQSSYASLLNESQSHCAIKEIPIQATNPPCHP